MARSNGNRRRPSGQAQQGGQARSQAQQGQSLADQPQDDSSRSAFSQFTDSVREHPKTAIAAGAAVAAGVAAATMYGTRGGRGGNSGGRSRKKG